MQFTYKHTQPTRSTFSLLFCPA